MWQPDVTVAAVCEQDGRFLLVEERAKSSGNIVFNQPAGHLDAGESLIEAVIRETREEACRHFTPNALIGVYRMQRDAYKTYIRFAFAGNISDHDHSLTLDPDIIANHWLSHAEIQSHNALRSAVVSRCVDDYLAGHRYPLDLLSEINV
ncbi:MAG: NUDIX hydrolase [Gammaproteobacteria bacterium]|nr:NUDIX hydrolase [Gammaproteobacteria bacterium]